MKNKNKKNQKNKGVTLVSIVIMIVIISIIATVTIINGSRSVKESQKSKEEQNLYAVKSAVATVSMQNASAGVYSPANWHRYGTSAKEVWVTETDYLDDWYILNETDLNKLGVDGVDETYVVNYKDGSVYKYDDFNENISNIIIAESANVSIKYTVNFLPDDENSVTGSMEPQSFVYGASQNLSPNLYSKEGHHFTGWITSPDYTGEPIYVDKQKVINLASEDGAVINLYTKWDINSYIIRFVANGGTGNMSEIIAQYDENIDLTQNAFAKVGYKFTGWNTKADGSGTPYSNGQGVKNLAIDDGSVVILYAQWQFDEDNICLANGTYFKTLQAAINSIPENGVKNTISLLKNVNESISIGANKNVYIDLQNHTFGAIDSSDLIENSGTLELANGSVISGGEVVTNSGRFIINNGVSLSSTSTTKSVISSSSELAISGGSISSNNSKCITNSGTALISGGTISADKSDAIRNEGILTISGGTIQTGSTARYTIYNDSSSSLSVTGGRVVADGSASSIYNIGNAEISGTSYIASSSNSKPAIENYDSGIMLITNGSIISTGLNSICNLASLTIGSQDGLVSENSPYIFAKNYAISSSSSNSAASTGVNFNFYDGALIGGGTQRKAIENQELGTINTETGYSIQNITTELSGDTYYKAFLSILQHALVTFNANGGSTSENSRYVNLNEAIGTLPTANRDGYTFDGWFTASTGGSEVTASTVITNNSVTLYAHWSKNVARIGETYYSSLQSAVNAVSSSKTTIELLGDLEENITIASSKNVDLHLGGYKLSSTSDTYLITNNGTLEISGGTIEAKNGAINNSGTGATLITSTGTFKSKDGIVINNINGNVTINGSTINSENYRGVVNSGTCTFNSGTVTAKGIAMVNSSSANMTIKNGTIESTTEKAIGTQGTLTIGNSTTSLQNSDPTIKGATFAISSAIDDGNSSSGVVFTFYNGILMGKGSQNVAIDRESNSTIIKRSGCGIAHGTAVLSSGTYYTAYLSNSVTVTFNANGGSVSETTRTVSANSAIGELPVPTRASYAFIGWFTAQTSGTQISASTTVGTSNVTYYAHWSEAVASVNSVNYPTLQSAIDSVSGSTSTTVNLLKNTSECVSVGDNQNIVLNLGGFTLSNNASPSVITNTGTLTIQNGTITSNSNENSVITNNKKGVARLYIVDANIINNGSRSAIYDVGCTIEIRGSSYITSSSSSRATINGSYTGNITPTQINLINGQVISINNTAIVSADCIVGNSGDSVDTSLPRIVAKDYAFGIGTLKYYDGISIAGNTMYSPNCNLLAVQEGYLINRVIQNSGDTQYKHYSLISNDVVAESNETYYLTLQAAIDAVPTDGTETTIRLLKDTEEYGILVSNQKNIILDLQNHKITNSSTLNIIKNNGTLKIINGTINNTNTETTNNAILNRGNLTIGENAIITSSGERATIEMDGNVNTFVLNVNGGSVISEKKHAIWSHSGGATTIISGNSQIISYNTDAFNAIYVNSNLDKLTIRDGASVISTGASAIYMNFDTYNGESLTIGTSGDGVTANLPYIQGASHGILIRNSSVNYYDGVIKGITSAFDDEGNINEIETNYGIKHSQETISGDIYKVVRLASGDDMVAQIVGGRLYESLQKAIDAVPTDKTETTVRLLKDHSTDICNIVEGHNIILDLQGHTLRNAGANTIIYNTSGKITIQNGKITSNANQKSTLECFNSNAQMTLSNVRVENTNNRGAIYNSAGATITIDDGSFIYSTTAERATILNVGATNNRYINNDNMNTKLILLDCTIVSTGSDAIQSGLITIGNSGDAVDSQTPTIIGKNYGINFYNINSQLEFYDGKIKGKDNAVNDETKITNLADRHGLQRTTETISGDTYKVLCLEDIGYSVEIVGGNSYVYLQDAIDAVPTDGTETTIRLLNNISEEGTTKNGQNIILDLQNKILSNSGNNKVLTNRGTITIKNGTITSNADTKYVLQNNSSMIIQDCLIKGFGTQSTIYNQAGILTISGDSYISCNASEHGTIDNPSGTVFVLSGQIISTGEAAINWGHIILGSSGDSVSTTSPVIQGITRGIYGGVNDTWISIYDGVLKGQTSAINNEDTVIEIPTGYGLYHTTEQISGDTYNIVRLSSGDGMTAEIVGGRKYESLQEAIDEVPTDGAETTIRLLRDNVDEAVTINHGKKILLDLNGFTINNTSTTAPAIYINYNATLTIQSGDIIGNNYLPVIDNFGSLTMLDGLVKSNRNIETIGTEEKSVIDNVGTSSRYTMNGGKVLAQGDNTYAIRVNGVKAYIGKTAEIIAEDYMTAIKATAATSLIDISGGIIKASGDLIDWYKSATVWSISGTINITGGKIIQQGNANAVYVHYSPAECCISGTPEIISKYGSAIGTGQSTTNTYIGSGDDTLSLEYPLIIGKKGTEGFGSIYFYNGVVKGIDAAFGDEKNVIECRADYGVAHTTETISGETYQVAYLAPSGEMVAKIVGGKYYDSLQGAVDASSNNADSPTQINLLKDSSGERINVQQKVISLDLQNHTLSNSGDNNVIYCRRATLNISNGTIDSDATSKYAIWDYQAGKTTLENVTVTTSNYGAICNQYGSSILTISGDTRIETQLGHAIYNSNTDAILIIMSGEIISHDPNTSTIDNSNGDKTYCTILGGKVVSTHNDAITKYANVELTIGSGDSNITNTPIIQGARYAIRGYPSINYYDGILYGGTSAFSNYDDIEITTEPNYGVKLESETIEGTTYEKASLGTPVRTITFDGCGATSTFTTRSVVVGHSIGKLPGLTDRVLVGWYTRPSGDATAISVNPSDIMPDSNITYYAHYTDAPIVMNGVGYNTIADAVSAITDSTPTTIHIYTDMNVGNSRITIDSKNVILDIHDNCTINNGGKDINLFYISGAGSLTLQNGILSTNATSKGAVDLEGSNAKFYMTGGMINVTGKRQAIYNNGGLIEISGNAYIYHTGTDRAAVNNAKAATASRLVIKGGTIISTNLNAIAFENGTCVIGNSGDRVNHNSPIIQGKKYGIAKANNTSNASAGINFEFYDGVIYGKTEAVGKRTSSTITTDTGCAVQADSVSSGDGTYYRVSIVASDPITNVSYPSTLSLSVGNVVTPALTYSGTASSITYYSENTDVVDVNSDTGEITAIDTGTAAIIVTLTDAAGNTTEVECEVTVT